MTHQPAATAEIVTFRALPGHSDETVMAAAAALGPFLRGAPGFIARHLSRSDDGNWTDHVLWTSLDAALAAAERIMADPAAAPFMAAIDPASIRMTHAPVLVAQQSA